ncbi:MAG: hypothetical protein LRY68_06455, partial [Sulfurospirillum sp.]|nr:hypothetical protein [Sulfurospirillum sp.]
ENQKQRSFLKVFEEMIRIFFVNLKVIIHHRQKKSRDFEKKRVNLYNKHRFEITQYSDETTV